MADELYRSSEFSKALSKRQAREQQRAISELFGQHQQGEAEMQLAMQLAMPRQEVWDMYLSDFAITPAIEQMPTSVSTATLSDKEKLAEELGMRSYVREAVNKREVAEEIKKLTDMKFKVTTSEKVVAKIMAPFHKKYAIKMSVIVSLVIAGGLSAVVAMVYGCAMKNPLVAVGGAVAFAAALFFTNRTVGIAEKHGQLRVDSKPIELWDFEMPMGGMLAIKEAQAKGIGNFRVHYPTYSSRMQELLREDPIITGMKGDLMVEVFYWDAGRTYE